MPTPSDEQTQVYEALSSLAAAVEHLQTRYETAQRANRRVRVVLFCATLLLLGGAVYMALSPVAHLLPQIVPQKLAKTDPEAAKAQKMQLLEALPAEERAKIELFERQVSWLREYMDVSSDFDAGAAVALFLAQMSRSVAVMPDMYAQVRSMNYEMQAINEEMRSMNVKMNALPVMARDVQGMNGKMDALPILAQDVQGMHRHMAVMSTGMDSTMGRAGRMMPWNW